MRSMVPMREMMFNENRFHSYKSHSHHCHHYSILSCIVAGNVHTVADNTSVPLWHGKQVGQSAQAVLLAPTYSQLNRAAEKSVCENTRNQSLLSERVWLARLTCMCCFSDLHWSQGKSHHVTTRCQVVAMFTINHSESVKVRITVRITLVCRGRITG